MKQIFITLKKNNEILFAILINIILLGIYIVSGTIKYEVSDDFVMNIIVSGGYSGEPSSYIMFMNPIVGKCLSFLYNLTPAINWYLYMQLLIIFISLIILTIIFIKKYNSIYGYFIVCVFLLFFSNDLYQLMQFTKTSGLAIVTANILYLNYMLNPRKKIFMLANIFCLIGLLIRIQCIFLTIPFAGIATIALYLNNRQIITLKLYVSRLFKILGCIFAFYIFLNMFQDFYINKHQDYKEYIEYSKIRANIVDFPTPAYEEYENEFKNVGISKNDYEIFISWNFADTEYYSIEKIKAIQNVVKQYRKNNKIGIMQYIRTLLEKHYWEYMVFIGGGIIVITLLFNRHNFYKAIIFMLLLGILLLLNLIRGRLVYRIEYVMFLCMICNYIYIANNIKININKKTSCIILLFITLTRIPLWIPEYDEQKFGIMNVSWANDIRKYNLSFKKNNQLNLIKEMKEHPNNIYFLGFQTMIQTFYLNFYLFDETPIYGNFMYLSGVDIKNPSRNQWLKNNHIVNPMKSLLDQNVYLIENERQNDILEFIRKNIKSDAKITLYKEIDGCYLWKIT